MAKKLRSKQRGASRKVKHNRKSHRRMTHRRKSQRRKGGSRGAPLDYHLSGSWPSRMSLGQGDDYFKYHEGQHGGVLAISKFPDAVMSSGLPDTLRGPAHISGIDKAFADVAHLKDQAGGKRRKHRMTRRKGGALGYAPFPNQGMLLNSSKQYAEAGLNPGWKSDIAFIDAKIRNTH